MSLRFASFVATSTLALTAACGPNPRGGGDDGTDQIDAAGGGDPDATPQVVGVLRGRVWAPNMGLGQAPPGQEIPVFGATVYLTGIRPDPIPAGVYCEECVQAPPGGVVSSHDGSFEVAAPPGTYWLVIQKGQFRLEQEYTIDVGTVDLGPAATTLPSEHDPAGGKFMPKIALVRGGSDNVQDIMGKIGIGTMVGNSFSSANGEMDMYEYSATPGTMGTAEQLLRNPAMMAQYHIIFFPCATSMSSIDTVLRDQNVLRNVRQYVHDGGKLYVTDWSGEVVDRSFPQQITHGDTGTDSTGTYDPVALTGTLATVGDADGGSYTSPDAEAVDTDLSQWLGLQSGPTPSNPTGATMFNPAAFDVQGNWNWISTLTDVPIGVDPMTSLTVYDTPKPWVIGSKPSNPVGKKPLAVTYEPTGCGRVLYSTYQTSNSAHAGLFPQERILLYLIMELGQCSATVIE